MSNANLALRVFPEMVRSSRIGLIAGWGRFPIVVAEALREQGCQVYCVGIKDHVDPALRSLCQEFREGSLTRFGPHLRFFRRHGVTHVTMAGKVHKSLFFQRFFLLTNFPDWYCIRAFYPHFISARMDRKDDTLLTATVNLYAKYGITIVPATNFAPNLLVRPGQLCGKKLTNAQKKDVEFGWRLAKGIGQLDIGQTVVVKGQAVLAVEAVEGTDQCIGRAGQLCESGGFTVVKVAKPQQDMRFDVPTIGFETLQTIARAGGRVLAVEAEKTIIIDQPKLVEFAMEHGISIVAKHGSSVVRRVAA